MWSASCATTDRSWLIRMIEAPALLHRLELGEHLRLHGHVERRGRLVGDHDVGVEGDRRRDQRALAQAAGELVGTLPRAQLRGGTPTRVEQLDHALGARARSPQPCRRSASAISAPTGRSGSSETRASCRMNPTSRPRTRRHSRVLKRARRPRGAARARSASTIDAAPGEADQGARGDALAGARLADDRDALARRRGRSRRPCTTSRRAPSGVKPTRRFAHAQPGAAGQSSSTEVDDRRSRDRSMLISLPFSRCDCRWRPMVVAASATRDDDEAGDDLEPPGLHDVARGRRRAGRPTPTTAARRRARGTTGSTPTRSTARPRARTPRRAAAARSAGCARARSAPRECPSAVAASTYAGALRGEDLAAHHAGVARRGAEPDREDLGERRRSGDRDEQQREQQRREGEQHLDEPVDHDGDRLRAERRERAEDEREHDADGRGAEADQRATRGCRRSRGCRGRGPTRRCRTSARPTAPAARRGSRARTGRGSRAAAGAMAATARSTATGRARRRAPDGRPASAGAAVRGAVAVSRTRGHDAFNRGSMSV